MLVPNPDLASPGNFGIPTPSLASQGPVEAVASIIDNDMTGAPVREGVFQGIYHEFGNQKAEADGNIARHTRGVDPRSQRQLLVVVDHRGGDAFTKRGEIRR